GGKQKNRLPRFSGGRRQIAPDKYVPKSEFTCLPQTGELEFYKIKNYHNEQKTDPRCILCAEKTVRQSSRYQRLPQKLRGFTPQTYYSLPFLLGPRPRSRRHTRQIHRTRLL